MSESTVLRIALAQINTTVGDLPGNRTLAEEAYRKAVVAGASIVVFPELTLTGYPPEDLLLKPSFLEDTRASLDALAPKITGGIAIVGWIEASPAGPRNAAALVARGRVRDVYQKCTLPNYGVFDEKRYFVPARRCPVYCVGPWRIAINICEDVWARGGVPALQAREGGANLMLNISASPYHARKGRVRERLVRFHARELGLTIAQTNLVGGQDELVFDGQSLAADAVGRLIARAPQFMPHILLVDLPLPGATPAAEPPGATGSDEPPGSVPPPAGPLELDVVDLNDLAEELREVPAGAGAPDLTPAGGPAEWISVQRAWPELADEAEVYRALTLGLADYARKNGFRGVVIGVSGGIDSALTAAIAADALGPEAVVGISMPSGYTSAGTRYDARRVAENLGIAFHEIPIGGLFEQTLRDLHPILNDRPPDVTEENLQARIRGMILMAFSNKFGHLVLATGNKTEVAVGYCTLYGDMVGGFSVLKDVLKTQVYRLAEWRNAQSPGAPPIPADTIARPPSAELRPDQKDTDSLPPYETLDPIVKALVEDDAAPRDLLAQGFDAAMIERVFAMIQGNEYKRRQAAPGIKITPRAFGRDRRYPLTNRYRPRAV
jgi:NAD+ synthase (glutamine-hydrolysing)